MNRARAIALTLLLVDGTAAAGCNLLVGDYSIRDGESAAIADAAPEDIAPSDRAQTDRLRPDRPRPGKSNTDEPDAGEADDDLP